MKYNIKITNKQRIKEEGDLNECKSLFKPEGWRVPRLWMRRISCRLWPSLAPEMEQRARILISGTQSLPEANATWESAIEQNCCLLLFTCACMQGCCERNLTGKTREKFCSHMGLVNRVADQKQKILTNTFVIFRIMKKL